MAKVVVQPKRQRGELIFLLSATVGIILVAVLAIAIRKSTDTTQQRLRSYQISGTSELTGPNQEIFLDLYTAAIEIEYSHQLSEVDTSTPNWPSIISLQNNLIAPFVKDQNWERRARLEWRGQSTGGDDPNINQYAYLGRSSDPSIAGSFLILFEHYHSSDGTYYLAGGKEKAYSIWFRDGGFNIPASITEGTLINNGWKEVVPITGQNQREQVNR